MNERTKVTDASPIPRRAHSFFKPSFQAAIAAS